MMRDLWNALPDNRPITSICVVEEPHKCPPGYQVVSRTYDQDTDADLWKDGFFGRKITRYLCLSKTEGHLEYIVEDIAVINERDTPPDGYTLLSQTHDTDQKAMRKKQFCYKLCGRSGVEQAVTDIIILSKSKQAPQGFSLVGEMNSLLICKKIAPTNTLHSSPTRASATATLPYRSSPTHTPPMSSTPPVVPPHLPYSTNPYAQPQPTVRSLYPVNQLQQQSSQGTLGSTNYLSGGLDGIPFELNPKYKDMQLLQNLSLPQIGKKSASDVESEFSYDFSTELQAQQRIPQDLQ